MSKKRVTPFKEAHCLVYGLEIVDKNEDTAEVNSVRCRFCVAFRKEGRTSNPVRMRKVTDNIKCFTKPFRADNYKSHLKTHTAKWTEYQACSTEEKKAFFNNVPNRFGSTHPQPPPQPRKFLNTLDTYFEIKRRESIFCFDADIVKKLIGDALFDLNDVKECRSKERALSLFKKSEDGDEMYTVRITNLKQFKLAVKYFELGSSFQHVTHIFQGLETDRRVDVSLSKVIGYARILVAISLQSIKDLLARSWCYSVAFESSTNQRISYLDIRIRVYHRGEIRNLHVVALPMLDNHTEDYMYELFEKLFDTLDPSWKDKLVGLTTYAAASMTESHMAMVTKIQNKTSSDGFYRIWCALHQLDIVVQRCVTKYFSDDFYGELTGLIGYLSRQKSLTKTIKSECPQASEGCWRSLGKVCKWFHEHRCHIFEYLNEKNPDRKPAVHWWVYVAVLDTIITEANHFVTGQGLMKMVGEQHKTLDNLKCNLLEILGGHRVIFEEADDDNNYIEDDFIVPKEYAIAMIKDCGLFYQKTFMEATPAMQKDLWRDVSKFVISIVIGIEEIGQQKDTSSGYKVPPVVPCELIKLRSFEFNQIVNHQARRFLCFDKNTNEELELIQEQHRELLSACRSEKPLREAIKDSAKNTSFNEGWKCIGSGRFEELKEFCGCLATVFPGISATAEFDDFSTVNNYEKNNENRTAFTDLSLEGLLHSKQYEMIASFRED
mmetsp:Transcript_25482/g.53099  ORF Transcript_25482/g.53099 Transcript_25482/m.53099 type:complete len:719 (+) Transcript_25482:100-2256(+)